MEKLKVADLSVNGFNHVCDMLKNLRDFLKEESLSMRQEGGDSHQCGIDLYNLYRQVKSAWNNAVAIRSLHYQGDGGEVWPGKEGDQITETVETEERANQLHDLQEQGKILITNIQFSGSVDSEMPLAPLMATLIPKDQVIVIMDRQDDKNLSLYNGLDFLDAKGNLIGKTCNARLSGDGKEVVCDIKFLDDREM